jgi:MFS family permease
VGARADDLRLGMRANLAQVLYLVAISALIGGSVGQERAIVPLLAERTFGLTAVTSATAFIAAYGLAKAATNLVASTLTDRIGRRPTMIAGWALGVPVPLLLMWAPSWAWVVGANLLLGAHDGFTSSTLVVMTIDLVGSARRGIAMGIMAGAGYLGLAASAFVAGLIAARSGLRPEPFFVGLACAVAGLAIAALLLRETRQHAHHEADTGGGTWSVHPEGMSFREAFALVAFRDRAMSACTQSGFVNSLNDAVAWGVFPLLFASRGLDVREISSLAALYAATWGLGQFGTGALSDRVGRKWVIAAGMWVQAAGLVAVAASDRSAGWVAGILALGLGTAMVYPTQLAAVGDAAHPRWRGSAVGVFRLWRDLGLVAGAVLGGALADAFGLPASISITAGLTAASGAIVAVRMTETRGSPA